MGKYCILLGLFAVVFHLMLDNEKILKNEMELNTKLEGMVFELKALNMELEEELRIKKGIITELELKVKNCTQVDTYISLYEFTIFLAKELGIVLAYKLADIIAQVGIDFLSSLLK